MTKQNTGLSNLLFELASLNHLPRSGLVQFFFDDFESIAAHSYKVIYLSFFLAQNFNVDLLKILTMAIFHDASETRTGDSNWVQKQYLTQNEEQAIADQFANLSPNLKQDLKDLLADYHRRQSLEAKIVKDADYLAYYITLKEMQVKGNQEASKRLSGETKDLNFLFLAESKKILTSILKSDPNAWTRSLIKKTLTKKSNK